MITRYKENSSLPKAYGGCRCPCHRTGAKHIVPCCYPKDKETVEEIVTRKAIISETAKRQTKN